MAFKFLLLSVFNLEFVSQSFLSLLLEKLTTLCWLFVFQYNDQKVFYIEVISHGFITKSKLRITVPQEGFGVIVALQIHLKPKLIGLRQGCCFSSLMFAWFINDLPETLIEGRSFGSYSVINDLMNTEYLYWYASS